MQPLGIFWRAATLHLPDTIKRTFKRSASRCVIEFDNIGALELLTNGCNLGVLDLGRKDNKVVLAPPLRLRYSVLTGDMTLVCKQAAGKSLSGAPQKGSDPNAPDRDLTGKFIVLAKVYALPK